MNAHIFHQSVPIKKFKSSAQETVSENASYFMLVYFLLILSSEFWCKQFQYPIA